MEPSNGQTGFNFAELEDDAPDAPPAAAPAAYHPVSGVATLDSCDIGFEADDEGAAAAEPFPPSPPPIAVERPGGLAAPPLGLDSSSLPPLEGAANPDDIVARFLEVYKEKVSADDLFDTAPLPRDGASSFPPDDVHDSTVDLPEEFTDSDTIVTGAYGTAEERPAPSAGSAATGAAEGAAPSVIDVLDDRFPRRRRANRLRETQMDGPGEGARPVVNRRVPLFAGDGAEGEDGEAGPRPGAAPAAAQGLLPSTLAWLRHLRSHYGKYKDFGLWSHLWGALKGARGSRQPRSSLVADVAASGANDGATVAGAAPSPGPEASYDTIQDVLAAAGEGGAGEEAADLPPASAGEEAAGDGGGEAIASATSAPALDASSDSADDYLLGEQPAAASGEAAKEEEEDILGLLDDLPAVREGKVAAIGRPATGAEAPERAGGTPDEEEIGAPRGESARPAAKGFASTGLSAFGDGELGEAGETDAAGGTGELEGADGLGAGTWSGDAGDWDGFAGAEAGAGDAGDFVKMPALARNVVRGGGDGMVRISGDEPPAAAGDGWQKVSGGGLGAPGKSDGWRRESGDGSLAGGGSGDGWTRVVAGATTDGGAAAEAAPVAGGDDYAAVAADSVDLADLTDDLVPAALDGLGGEEPEGAAAVNPGGAASPKDAVATDAPGMGGEGADWEAAPLSDDWADVDLDILEKAEAPAPLVSEDWAGAAAPAAPAGAEAAGGMEVPPIVARLWAGGQALGKALAGGLARLRAGLRRKKDGAPPPAADAVAPLPPVDENVVIGVSPTNNAPVEAPAAPGWDTVPTPPAALTDLDDILPTSDAAFSGADGDWPDTGSGPGGFTLSGDANLDGLTGLLGDDDFMAAAPEGNAAPDGGWMSAAAIRTWGRLVNAYKAVDRIVDFRKNWWLLVDGVAVVIMTVSFAVILGYFLYHR